MTSAGIYRRLLRTPGIAAITVLAFLARLPVGMVTIGLLLFTREVSTSFAVPGLVVAAFAVTAAASSPAKGALLDRYGARTVLVWTAALTTAPLVLLVGLRPTAAPVLVAVGALTGIGTAPVSPAVRSGYARMLSGEELRAAYSLDTIGMELVYLTGPALVGLLIAVGGSPGTALLGAAALTVAGTLGLALSARHPAVEEKPGGSPSGRARLSTPVWLAIVAAVPQAASLGLVEVVVSAAAVDVGRPAAVGVLLMVWAAGSVVGGLVFGGLRWRLAPGRQYAVLLLAGAAGLALLTVSDSLLWLGILLFLAGLPTSAAWAAGAAVVAEARPDQRGRAYGWLQGTTNAGAAGGYALGGLVVGWAGVDAGYLLGAALAAAACALAAGIGRTREPAPSNEK